MDTLSPGTVLNGKWTLGAPLGSGGAGVVYSATHRNGTRAAVKVLHPALVDDEDRVARFLREGAIVNHLAHPGVVAALDDDRSDDGLVYLVLELVEGTPLAQIIHERAPMAPAEALAIVDKILDVLKAAHDKGVIHRDIKPANVVLLPNGAIKILDFGVARAGELESGPVVRPTAQGAILGTPCFMAPEQARGRTDLVDARTDLWATAALLFASLTGRPVHGDGVPSEALARAMIRAAPPIRSIVHEVPDAVARVVDRGLAFDREARFQDARSMQFAVRLANREMRAERASFTRSAETAPSHRPSFATFVGLGLFTVAVTAVVASATWLARSNEPPKAPAPSQAPAGRAR